MKKALVVGGNSGLGEAITIRLLKRGYDKVYIVGRNEPQCTELDDDCRKLYFEKTAFYKLDLNMGDFSIFDQLTDVDTLVITSGFGRTCLFEDLTEKEIDNLVKCNELAAIQIIKKYYNKIKSSQEFKCAIIVSICGHIVSPLFSVYGAAKAGLSMFIKNLNIELNACGINNRVLDCSPGAFKGTKFHGDKNDPSLLFDLADKVIDKMNSNYEIFIPKYNNIYKNVIERNNQDYRKFGIESFNYKSSNIAKINKPQVIIGYLSGTFDLFHIGHLNLLKRAKSHCDYLIVGVHESGAWKGKETFIPFEERKAIVGSIKYVDKVIQSFPEDAEAWAVYHYNKLFVGSDYKGSERFERYERYFSDKDVEIIYFPYTQGTSSTQLRLALKKI